jgi:hypothetical protein
MQSTTEPSSPNPQIQVLIFTLIRAVMQILGAFGITWAMTVSAATWEIVAGALAILLSTVWGLWQKFQQARLDHAGNVASARAAQAIKVVAQDGVPPV